MKRKQWKEPLLALALVATAALLLSLAGAALRPFRDTYGSTWRAYLAEPKHSIDVLYLGSSYAYCDVNPALVYEESALTGYVMAGSEQTFSITYWYLQEALKTQSPAAAVIEVSALFFNPYQAYTQTNVGYMPFSLHKLGAIFTASEPDKRLGLLWDLYFYHDRWKSITSGDLKQALTPVKADHYKGYTPVMGVFAGASAGPVRSSGKHPEDVYRENLAALRHIVALCRSRGVRPILTLNPTFNQYTPETSARLRTDLEALGQDVRFLGWSDGFAQLGLDPALHLFDGGHLNREGATIFSARLGAFLRDEAGLIPRPQTPENAVAWRAAQDHWTEK